ncbi:uncharacterized protein LOC126252468 [Schistocerca nitens]|uniref:uncharacterized protein LOC126252468 n=1 Tax=Schistocerca nitens TaxID=7011 RepID=UPI0021185E3F|nr:uncharacterized protein LOC126252468 [Schistocerca nitens]
MDRARRRFRCIVAACGGRDARLVRRLFPLIGRFSPPVDNLQLFNLTPIMRKPGLVGRQMLRPEPVCPGVCSPSQSAAGGSTLRNGPRLRLPDSPCNVTRRPQSDRSSNATKEDVRKRNAGHGIVGQEVPCGEVRPLSASLISFDTTLGDLHVGDEDEMMMRTTQHPVLEQRTSPTRPGIESSPARMEGEHFTMQPSRLSDDGYLSKCVK